MTKLDEIRTKIEEKYLRKSSDNQNKILICFKIDFELIKEFKVYCQYNKLYMSNIVEKEIRKHLKK